jgi:hypothetical protein
MARAATFFLALGLVYLVAFVLADGLRFEPVKDEVHFLDSAQIFAGSFEVEDLRSYPELVTPLALVAWGALENLTGAGLWAGRCLNFVLSFGLVCLVAFARSDWWPRGALAALGLLLFPYTLPLSVHLYTDIMAVAFAGLGTLALLRKRAVLAFLALSAAIATRQYLVQVPAALAAAEAFAWYRGDAERWRTALAAGAATATLGAWVVFFGGLAPRAGLDAWIPLYPAPMLEASALILHYGLYALSGVGAYFVLVEALLFRGLPPRAALLRRRNLVAGVVLAGLFLVDPPILTSNHPGGPLGRAARFLLPSPEFDLVRVGIYYVLALLTVVRFAIRIDVAFWIVAAGTVLAMKQQIPWEKYLLPTLSSLWMLRASGNLLAYGEGERTASTSKSLTKQSSPTVRLSTYAPAFVPKMLPETNVLRVRSASRSNNETG